MALRSELHTISICTGGGGLDLGLELAVPGSRAVCMVEREAFGAARLASAMEDGLLAQAPVWSDARTFNGMRSELSRIDFHDAPPEQPSLFG